MGPSFISIYDAEWNEIETIALNDGDYAFRVMLETEGDDIYVAYDEMDLYAWNPTSQAKLEHFRITAQSPGVPGDYNEDGTVNAADYNVWRDKLGSNILLPNEDPSTTPGIVTEEDYLFWKSRFGGTSGSESSITMPEPATALLVLLAAVGALPRRVSAQG